MVDDNTELWNMCNHLEATVLDKNAKLAKVFQNMFMKYITRYNIQYCTAKANRYVLVQCRSCNGAFFGIYPRGYKKEGAAFVSAFAAFLGEQLQDGETQV